MNSAAQAREQYQGTRRIEIVDSHLRCMGLDLATVSACRADQNGASLEEVGHIGKARTLVGSLLRIKPILMIRDGEVHPAERAYTRGKGMERLSDLGQELAQRLKPCLRKEEIVLKQIGPVVGTYLRPRVLGVTLRSRAPGSL